MRLDKQAIVAARMQGSPSCSSRCSGHPLLPDLEAWDALVSARSPRCIPVSYVDRRIVLIPVPVGEVVAVSNDGLSLDTRWTDQRPDRVALLTLELPVRIGSKRVSCNTSLDIRVGQRIEVCAALEDLKLDAPGEIDGPGEAILHEGDVLAVVGPRAVRLFHLQVLIIFDVTASLLQLPGQRRGEHGPALAVGLGVDDAHFALHVLHDPDAVVHVVAGERSIDNSQVCLLGEGLDDVVPASVALCAVN